MKKYPVKNTIFEGKCFILDMDLDDIIMVESVRDLAMIEKLYENPYYGRFLDEMKSRRHDYDTVYNRMCYNVEYNSNKDRFDFFKTFISSKRIGIIGLMKYLKLRGLDSITNYNGGKSNSKLLSILEERR